MSNNIQNILFSKCKKGYNIVDILKLKIYHSVLFGNLKSNAEITKHDKEKRQVNLTLCRISFSNNLPS